MSKDKKPDTLEQIWHVCRSPGLSKDAKLAFVMLAAPEIAAVQCYTDPPDDTMRGLYELATKGLISLEIEGAVFKSRITLSDFYRAGI